MRLWPTYSRPSLLLTFRLNVKVRKTFFVWYRMSTERKGKNFRKYTCSYILADSSSTREEKNRQYWTRKMLSDCDHEPWLLLLSLPLCVLLVHIIYNIIMWYCRMKIEGTEKFKKIIQKNFFSSVIYY